MKQVHLERAATRYCLNMDEHAHFLCETCGVFDFEGGAKPRTRGSGAEAGLL